MPGISGYYKAMKLGPLYHKVSHDRNRIHYGMLPEGQVSSRPLLFKWAKAFPDRAKAFRYARRQLPMGV